MNSVPPRLRPDLEIKSQPATDGPVYILKDPVSGEFYRLHEAEYFVASQFDGETSLEVIRERAEEHFGATLPAETLSAFVKVLFKSHLLEGGEADAKRKGRGGFVRGSSLYLRFKVWDPDAFLERLVPRLEFLFTPLSLVLSVALILLAMGTMITNRFDMGNEIATLSGLASIPFIVVVLFALVSLHEFGHGVACKRFGGSVHEMGFMLIYFQPALYCNVSDSWLFPDRSQRIWVGFAGPYVELTLWAAATLLWRITDPGSWIHIIALIVAGSAGIKTLLNFNPLLKFDGYYLLSDYLDVPNLRTKSFAYIGEAIKRSFRRAKDRVDDIAPRLRRIYLTYGIAAVAFSWCALVFAIVIVGDYFIDNRAPISILLACALVGVKMRRRVRRLFVHGESAVVAEAPPRSVTAIAAAARETARRDVSAREASAREGSARESSRRDGSDRRSSRHRSSNGETSMKEASSSRRSSDRESSRREPADRELSRREKTEALVKAAEAPVREAIVQARETAVAEAVVQPAPRWEALPPRPSRPWLGYALAGGVLAAVLFTTRLELRIAGPFNVLPEENADVRSPLEQIVEEIYVDEGDIVKAGDRIARLDARPLRAEMATTDAAVLEARAILGKLQHGATAAEIAVAKAGVDKGEDSLMYAGRRVERLQTLYKQGLVSQKELDDALEGAAAAQNNRTEAGTRLHLLEVGTRPEEIAATRARLEQLESQRRYLEEQMALLEVVSPVGGVVATPTRQIRELRRQLVKKGDLIVKVYDVSTVTAQIFVSERELDGIAVGNRVELRARAFPGTTFHGEVTSIATSAQGTAGVTNAPGVFASGGTDPNKSVIVTTRIENQSLLLKPEMTGQAKVFCGQRRIADLMARRAALTFRVALWSWW